MAPFVTPQRSLDTPQLAVDTPRSSPLPMDTPGRPVLPGHGPLLGDYELRLRSRKLLNCDTAKNPLARGNFSSACPNARRTGCLPAMYLLGVQKGATTAVSEGLTQCGLVSQAIPDGSMTPLLQCPEANALCKEAMHDDVNIKTAAGRKKFQRMHNPSRCPKIGREQVPKSRRKYFMAACEDSRFLAATPMYAGAPSIKELMTFFPKSHLQFARYAVIFRDSISRMLSWYNHQLESGFYWWPGTRKKPNSFAEFWDQCKKANKCGLEWSDYHNWLKEFSAGPVSRKQLLVLSYEDIKRSPATVMRRLTEHYGLPEVLTSMDALPEANTHSSFKKIVAMKCVTRGYMQSYFAPIDAKLFKRLDDDRSKGRSPPGETRFTRFSAATVPCDPRGERSQGALAMEELNTHFRTMGRRVPIASAW